MGGYRPAWNAYRPGKRFTVALCMKNRKHFDTRNLWVTLCT